MSKSNIWYPAQRAIRTAVQVVVAATAILATIVAIAPQIITAVADVVPGPIVAWATGAVAILAGISAAAARVMAIPAVDDFLSRFGAGSEPNETVIVHTHDGEVGMSRRQWRSFVGRHGGSTAHDPNATASTIDADSIDD